MLSIILCWFLFFVLLALRNEYDSSSKNYKELNIVVWIFGFLGPGLTGFFIVAAIYSCINSKTKQKREPLLNAENIQNHVLHV